MILSRGMRFLVGILIGVVLAFALMRFLSFLFYGVSPTDPFTFIVVPLALSAVALVATYIPARRATRFAPVVALRYE